MTDREPHHPVPEPLARPGVGRHRSVPSGISDHTADLLRAIDSSDRETSKKAIQDLDDVLIDGWLPDPCVRSDEADPCVPHLLELARDPDLPTRKEILELVTELSNATIGVPVTGVREALLGVLDPVAALMADPVPKVREWAVDLAGNLALLMRGVVARVYETHPFGTFTVPETALIPPGLDHAPESQAPGCPGVPEDVRALGDLPEALREAVRAQVDETGNHDLVRRDALTAAVLLRPEHVEWVGAYRHPDVPLDVRQAASWFAARAGMPWTSDDTEVVLETWGERAGCTEPEWFWEDRYPALELLCMRTEPDVHTAVVRELLARQTGRALSMVFHAVELLHDRHPASREGLRDLVRAAAEHPERQVRAGALAVMCTIDEFAREEADRLARLVQDPPGHGMQRGRPVPRPLTVDVGPYLWTESVRALIRIGDPRWRTPFRTELRAGRVAVDTWWVELPYAPELAEEVVAWLAASYGYHSTYYHFEVERLQDTLRIWGDRMTRHVGSLLHAAVLGCDPAIDVLLELTDELMPEAVPVGLAAHAADEELPLSRRLRFATALVALGIDDGTAERLVPLVPQKELEEVSRFARNHGVCLTPVVERCDDPLDPRPGARAEREWTLEELRLSRRPTEVDLDHTGFARKPRPVSTAVAATLPRPTPLEDGQLLHRARELWQSIGTGPWLRRTADMFAGSDRAPELLELARAVRAATPVRALGRNGTANVRPDRPMCDLLDSVIAELETAIAGRGSAAGPPPVLDPSP